MNMEDALFNTPLNVDYPFDLAGLFFPPLKKPMDLRKQNSLYSQIKYSIADNVENIVPDFLTMLHGVIRLS